MELQAVIGLEIHAQLATKSKLWCGCDNDAFGAEPNSRVCPVCMGFPGMLPVLNGDALAKGVRAGAAFGGKIQEFSKFDRKNYFYPDLPLGYQISQYDQPIVQGGAVDIEVEGKPKTVHMTRVHLENDAGKLTHTKSGTLCDYNRSGTPLVEIVTEPDMHSAEEAQALAKEIQKILRFVGASDADMEKGMMRFDASISLRPKGEDKLYPRAEIKNLNSFSSLYKAINHEIKKQTKAWEAGTPPTGATTVGWIDDEERTQILRDKEDAHDYRYFPEPDLPPMTFTKAEIEAIEASLPELPLSKRKRYQEDWGIGEAESLKLSETPELAEFFETSAEKSKEPQKAANLILSVVLADTAWQHSEITPKHIADSIALWQAGTVSASGAKEIIQKAIETGQSAKELVEVLGLEQNSDSSELEAWVDQAIADSPQSVADYKGGNEKAIGGIMGAIMKLSQGAANPPMVMEMLKDKLKKM